MQQQRRGGVFEHAAVAGVEISFSRKVLGKHDVVCVEFDMVVGDGLAFGVSSNAGAVDQRADRNKETVDQHGVVGRESEITARRAISESMSIDQDRLGQLGCRVAKQIKATVANPCDRTYRTSRRHDALTNRKMLDRGFAPFGQNAGTGAEAGRSAQEDVRAAAAVRGEMEEVASVVAGHLLGIGVAALADRQQIGARRQASRSAAGIGQERHVDAAAELQHRVAADPAGPDDFLASAADRSAGAGPTRGNNL